MEIKPYQRTTQFYETDQMGIIHHANYIYWMEEARVDYMEQIGFGYDKATEAGIDFALLGIQCEYKSMTRFHEQLQIQVSLKDLTPTRVTVEYQIYGPDSTLRFKGESRHCFYSTPKQRPISLKKELPDLYNLLMST